MSSIDLVPPPSRSLWAFALLGALALHLGAVAVGLVAWSNPDADDDVGAPGIEIGVELAAPRGEVMDAPVGPDSEASAASSAQAEQKVVEKENELPKETPHEAEEPDRLVTAMPQKDREPDPNIKPEAVAPSRESAASEAAAMPTSESAPVSDRSTTLAQGVGEAVARARVKWRNDLSATLKRHLRYPTDRVRQTAAVIVTFSIDRAGRLKSATIAKSSGDQSFDAAALAMLKRADPLPPPPVGVADDDLTLTAPVDFTVKGTR